MITEPTKYTKEWFAWVGSKGGQKTKKNIGVYAMRANLEKARKVLADKRTVPPIDNTPHND